jgi:high-affinity iron transporter
MAVSASSVSSSATPRRLPRGVVWAALLAVLGALVYLMATAKTGPVDPTEVGGHQSHGTVLFNAAMIVFREGLEAVLIFAAITASFQGADKARRRPVVAGAVVSFAAAVATWFIAQAVLEAASPLGARLEAITGFIAVVVLFLVLNWFVHKVYWTGWIAKHHRQRRKVLGRVGISATVGLIALGFTSVYREGFEVVLFLQNLQLKDGTSVVLEGVAIGLACTAVVGVLTFVLHQKLPYRRMLVVTGILIGVVLVVMIGGTARTFVDLGWLPGGQTPFAVPEWLGSWFEIYPYWAPLVVQALTACFVVGSYYAAEYVRVKRPRRRGEATARRAEAAPVAPAPARREWSALPS